MNNITLLGNLTRDVELRYSQSGMATASTAIAVNDRQYDTVVYIDLMFFGGLAEVANNYLQKGSKLCVIGKLDLDEWTQGDGQKRRAHKVIVDKLEMLNKVDTSTKPRPAEKKDDFDAFRSNSNRPEISINEDEIPF